MIYDKSTISQPNKAYKSQQPEEVKVNRHHWVYEIAQSYTGSNLDGIDEDVENFQAPPADRKKHYLRNPLIKYPPIGFQNDHNVLNGNGLD